MVKNDDPYSKCGHGTEVIRFPGNASMMGRRFSHCSSQPLLTRNDPVLLRNATFSKSCTKCGMSSPSEHVTASSFQVVQSGDTRKARVFQGLASGGVTLRLLQLPGLGFIASHPTQTILQSIAFFQVTLLLLVASLPFAVSSLQARVFQEFFASVTHDHVEAFLFTLFSFDVLLLTRLTNFRVHVQLANNLRFHLVLVLLGVATPTIFRSCTW